MDKIIPLMSNNSTDLTGLPDPLVEAGQKFFKTLAPFFPAGALSVGGGPVLAARWSHRPVQSIKVYAHPEVLARAHTRHGYGHAIMEALAPLASAPIEETIYRPDIDWTFGQFTAEIDGIPIYVLATSAAALSGRQSERFPGTDIGVWDTADILADTMRRVQKFLNTAQSPLHDDLQDLAAAHTHDRASLNAAFGRLEIRQRQVLIEALRRCESKTVTPASVADLLEGPVNRGAGLEFSLGS